MLAPFVAPCQFGPRARYGRKREFLPPSITQVDYGGRVPSQEGKFEKLETEACKNSRKTVAGNVSL